MEAFACPVCRSLIFFEDFVCVTCATPLSFDRDAHTMVALDARPYCRNAALASCNWLGDPALEGYCGSCWLTRTRPADSDEAALAAFAVTETAKRRLVFQLDDLKLPTTPRSVDPEHGLAFDLLSSRLEPVVTGHASGAITIDLAEGNDPHREALRISLAEPYRTMLGHLRHEIGHWYWDVLVDHGPFLGPFRELFGDERIDYSQSLEQHYGAGGATDGTDWAADHVSHYAAAHPWEDWAESFAHYLHIRDTMQTAAAWGVHTDGPDLDLSLAADATLAVTPTEDPRDFDELVRQWLAFSIVLNGLNRSMGRDDLYPFVLTPAVLQKLRFVHTVITSEGAPERR